MRWKAVWGRAAWLVIGAAALASVPACGPVSDAGRSPAYVIIESLKGASGAKPDKMAFTLQSDVQTFGSPFEDPGELTVRLGLRDPGGSSSANTPTTLNYITLTHYRVVYTRTDGRNTPGVDVPYPFEGGMTATVTAEATATDFVLVRVQAKLEPPLRALIGLGGAVVITTTAEVTFYGHDQTGNAVSVTGYITVSFADWGDPEA